MSTLENDFHAEWYEKEEELYKKTCDFFWQRRKGSKDRVLRFVESDCSNQRSRIKVEESGLTTLRKILKECIDTSSKAKELRELVDVVLDYRKKFAKYQLNKYYPDMEIVSDEYMDERISKWSQWRIKRKWLYFNSERYFGYYIKPNTREVEDVRKLIASLDKVCFEYISREDADDFLQKHRKVDDTFWNGFCPITHQIILDLVKRVSYRPKYRGYYAERKELYELIKNNKNKKNISNENLQLFYKTTWEGRRYFKVFVDEIRELSKQMDTYKPKEEKPVDSVF